MSVEIMDTTKLSRYFPAAPQPEIYRESFLDNIESLLSSHPIVVVEGPEGIGKTTLLAQFCRYHSSNSISVFINPITRISYDPDQIRLDLLNQVTWILTKKEIDDIDSIDVKDMWGRRIWDLQRRFQSKKQPFYIVIDGLSEIPSEDSRFQDMILDLLPIPHQNQSQNIVKFLISGEENKLSPKFKQAGYKTFPMSGVTIEEAYQLLDEFKPEKDDIKKLYQINKMPGFYASIRRILSSGVTIQELMEDLPKSCPEAFELEWRKVDPSNQNLMNILAVLAYSRLEFSLAEISNILGISLDTAREVIKPLTFITIGESPLRVSFINEHFRKFASSRLSPYKSAVENRIIEFLQTNPEDTRSIISLPVLYNQSGRHNELLAYLNPPTLLKILEVSQSLTQLYEYERFGALAAQELNRDGDFVGFSLKASVTKQMLQADVLESEINALVSLREIDSALALVERGTTKEEKFFLLSVLANAKQRYQLDIPGLEEQIKGFFKQIDIQKLGERAIDIATNLIHALPDLAFEIVEQATDSEDGENALDIAFVKLSLYAYQKYGDGFSSSNVMERIQNRIKNPELRNFCNTNITFLSYPASRIIREVEKVERASEKLFVLRAWVLHNRESQDAADVVEYGLKVTIGTTEYAPNARDFRELSVPLLYIKDLNRLKSLIKIFDGQKGTVERLGPIEDFVRLSLILASAEAQIDFEACRNRLQDIYLYINDIKSLETRTSCLARLAATLLQVDPDKKLEENDQIHSTVENELRSNITKLLNESADHYLVTRGVIRALAKENPRYALKIAQSLNAVERREKAVLDLINYYLELADNRIELQFIKECYDTFTTTTTRDIAHLEIIARLSNAKTLDDKNRKLARHFLENIYGITNPRLRSQAFSLSLSLLKFFETEKTKLEERTFKSLKETWEQIQAQWEKIDIGFKIIEALRDYPNEALDYLKNLNKIRETGNLNSDETAAAFILCAYLALKAFNGLLVKDLYSQDDINQLYNIIKSVSSVESRLALYNELALRFKISGRENKFSEIVREKIKPEINGISPEDIFTHRNAILISAPALYLFHPTSALSQFDELPIEYKDQALYKVAEFILLRRLDDEPYDELKPAIWKGIKYEDIHDVITLLEKIDRDSSAFSLIHKIAEAITSLRSNFSKQQRAEVARKIEHLIPQKFPNKKYIRHEGYVLVSMAQVLKIKPSPSNSEWNNLLERARKIENTADRVFILGYIAEAMPKKEFQRKNEILEEAFGQIQNIPSIHDQIGRCEVLASIALDFNSQLAKRCIQHGYQIGRNHEVSDTTAVLRELIDFAYKIDPELAASLASLSDDDPAREKSREFLLKRRLETLKLRDKIVKSEYSLDTDNKYDDDLVISAGWKLLGGLNSGRIAPIHFEKAREYALSGLGLPLILSYPIFAWLIQNGVTRYQNTDHAGEYIRPLFEAALTSCHLILRFSEKLIPKIDTMPSALLKDDRISQVVEGANIEKAREIINNWLRSNLSDYLLIADGYFGLEDLWVLQEINAINPKCEVYILTSKEHNTQYRQPWEEVYRNHWRIELSDQDPPITEVVIIGLATSGKSPIHDRWWITKGAGLRIGTSLHSLGETRISEITGMTESEAIDRENFIRRFVTYREKTYNGERLTYSSFTL